MRKIAACVVAICAGLFGCVSLAQAAEPFARVSYGGTFAGFPRGARNIGMGTTGTADVTGLSAGYFNPASVAYTNATFLLGSYEDMYFDMSLSEGLISTPIPFHSEPGTSAWQFACALAYTRLDFPVQQERTIFLPDGTGRTFDPDEWMLSGTGAVSWTRGVVCLSGGGRAKVLQQEYGEDATLWAFDLGLLAAFPMSVGGGRVRPRLGYAALNLDSGTSIHNVEVYVATESRGGFGFDLETPPVQVMGMMVPSVAFALDYDRIDRQGSSPIDFASGVELSIVQMFHVRYGVIDNESATYGVGAGWDYGSVLYRLDYAHVEPRQEPWLDGLDFDRDTFSAILGVRW